MAIGDTEEIPTAHFELFYSSCCYNLLAAKNHIRKCYINKWNDRIWFTTVVWCT